MYRPVNCLSAKIRGKNLRIVTAFFPQPANNSVTALRAEEAPADQTIDLIQKNDDIWHFKESELQKGCLPDNFMLSTSKT